MEFEKDFAVASSRPIDCLGVYFSNFDDLLASHSIVVGLWNTRTKLRTNSVKRRVDKDMELLSYRFCAWKGESISYIVSEISKFAHWEYETVLNLTGYFFHSKLCKEKIQFRHSRCVM